MSSREKIIKGLATLGDRQREVLSLVCQGNLYREIAEALVIDIGAVKSTMAQVYVKVGLGELKSSQKRKRLFQEVCPALAEGNIPPPSKEDRQLIVVPTPEVMAMVDEDEGLLARADPRALTVRPREEPRRRLPGWVRLLLIGLFIMLVIAGGVVLGEFVSDRMRGGGVAAVETLTPSATVEATATLSTATATPTATEEPEQQIIIVTATPLPATPTPLPADTPLPPPDTPVPASTQVPPTNVPAAPPPTNPPAPPQNTGLALDSWYSEGNIAISVSSDVSYTMGDFQKYPHVGFRIPIRNTSQNTISFEYGTWNFQLVDNLGNSHPIYGGDFSRSLTLDPGEMYRLYGDLGNSYVFFDVDYSNPAITQLTLIIRDLSSITYTEWVVPIYH